MPTEKPRIPPPKTDEEEMAELAKLTKDFAAALRRLIPAAERASKRGKHSLLRIISRKLPRLVAPAIEPNEDAEDSTEIGPIVFGFGKPMTREDCLASAAAAIKNGQKETADYWTTNAAKLKTEAEGGGPTEEEEARLAAEDKAFQERHGVPQDTTRRPAKTLAKTLVSENPPAAPGSVPGTHPTSGASRSANEEPWPGQTNFPRPKRGPMPRR
jgi:hypothetical protein